MKRIANIVSLATIVACIGAWLWMFRAPAEGPASGFKVGAARTVHFGAPPEESSDMDPSDQLRDWLLYAVLEESGLDNAALRKVLYDVPAERTGFTAPVGAFEYGETRFRILGGDGTVLALVPKDNGRRKDQLAQIADAARTSLGAPPRVVEVYEYSVDPAELTGTVTRLPNIRGETLFTAEYGFTEKTLASAADLESFLATADDVSAVEFKDGILRVSGRNTGLKSGRMRLEDVAALWQSEKSLAQDRSRIEDFDRRWQDQNYLESIAEEERKKQLAAVPGGDADDTSTSPSVIGKDDILNLYGLNSNANAPPLLNRKKPESIDDLLEKYRARSEAKSRLGAGTVSSPGRAAVEQRFKDKDYVQDLLQKRHDAEEEELRKSLSSKGSAGIPQGSGFSLDPSFDYKKLEAIFDEVKGMFAKDELENIRDHIQKKDEGPFLDAIYKVEQDKSQPMGRLFGKLAEQELQKAKFQHARYDGKLAGTEDGMVLFYTDLLAKLWALDYFDRAPEEQVRGVVPLLKVSVSPIYKEEERELSGTRLWFGPRDSGYSKVSNGLAFSRVATRVYAASSNTLEPGKEAEANASSSRFLGWWNDHYAQVAEFEPQYKRLNEIMKWSVILGWLPGADSLDRMSYLSGVAVKRDNWFPDWAQHNSELRFRDWTRDSKCDGGGRQKVEFYAKGYLGVDTESMPILYSCKWDGQAYSGGVSLGSKAEIESRAALAETVDESARRANLEPIAAAEKPWR